MKKNKEKYKLASSKKWMEQESSGKLGACLKLPQGVSIYKLKPGKAMLDVIPFVTGKGNPNAEEDMLWWERTFWVHRNIGPNQKTYVCPAMTANKPCPVCEERAEIMKNDPSDEEFKQAKALNAKQWQLIQLRDRNDEDKGIQILPISFYLFGEEIKTSIEAGDDDENLESFWHPDGGKSLRVLWAEDSMGSQKFTRAKNVDFKDRDDLDDELIEEGYCLDDLLIIPEYKKLKAAFASGEEDGSEEEDRPRKTKTSSKPKDDDEDDSDDEDDDPPKRGKSSSSQKSKTSSRKTTDDEEDDEDSDEDDDDDNDDDNDDEPPKMRRTGKPKWDDFDKKNEEVEDDEEDDEEEDEEDEEEERPKSKSTGRTSKKSDPDEDEEEEEVKSSKKDSELKMKKSSGKSSKSDDDDDEEDEDDDDDDDDDEPPKKKSKGQFGGKGKMTTADDDDDEEDEDDEPPKKRKKK